MFVFYYIESIRWIRLLPHVKCLHIDSIELKYWLTDQYHCQYITSFLQNLDQLYINCSNMINLMLNEAMITPLLSSIINRYHFPQLKCLFSRM